jgi:hypothetical protein
MNELNKWFSEREYFEVNKKKKWDKFEKNGGKLKFIKFQVFLMVKSEHQKSKRTKWLVI